jgi:hypothetical protein
VSKTNAMGSAKTLRMRTSLVASLLTTKQIIHIDIHLP